MSGTIKISELNTFPALLQAEDFFPIDKSSSLLTYRATLGQLQSLLSTGSFSGSLIGTASWAANTISSSYIKGINVSGSVLSSSYALTASYVSGSETTIGPGTANYLPIWTNTNTLGDSHIYYTASIGYVSNYKNIVINNDQAFFNSKGTYNCGYTLQSLYSASDAWQIACSTTETLSSARGLFDLSTYSGSNQLINKQSNDPDGNGTIRVLRITGNGVYFWPLGGIQSVSRDGTFNVGVDSGTQNTSSRLMVSVYSGSSINNPQTNHIHKAIEVTYGSGSDGNWPTTFCVSSSGKTYVGGPLNVNGGISVKSQDYDSISSPQQILYINSEDAAIRFIQLNNHATASLTMSRGHQLHVIVNQATVAATASLLFKGALYSGSTYYNCPIVWKNGSQPTITTGNVNRADFFTFMAVNTSTLGPSGSGAPDNTVIYAVSTQNMY